MARGLAHWRLENIAIYRTGATWALGPAARTLEKAAPSLLWSHWALEKAAPSHWALEKAAPSLPRSHWALEKPTQAQSQFKITVRESCLGTTALCFASLCFTSLRAMDRACVYVGSHQYIYIYIYIYAVWGLLLGSYASWCPRLPPQRPRRWWLRLQLVGSC